MRKQIVYALCAVLFYAFSGKLAYADSYNGLDV